MEPPAKRLRLLQSVEVDETNPEFVHEQQKQKQKFKGQLEDIFAKYESMHESMSDEIDMVTNEVVVDRGHLRRLNRQVNRRETVLLDTLGLTAGSDAHEESDGEGKSDQDSEDELAPTQPLPSSIGRTAQKRRRETDPTTEASSPSNISKRAKATNPTSPVGTEMQTCAPQVPYTPNPMEDLRDLVQFPQTPEGQQAQTSFYATLAQTINRAVQQAVAPLFSSLLSKTPNAQLFTGHALPAITTPIANMDKTAPAKDPKWFFPPLPQASSPRIAPQQKQHKSNSVERQLSPRVQVHKSPNHPSARADITIRDIKNNSSNMASNSTGSGSKTRKEKAQEWRLAALKQRHHQRVNRQTEQDVSGADDASDSTHHLPTPSSLGREEEAELHEYDIDAETNEVPQSSSVHYDDDDRDLLSLAGGDLDEEQESVGDEDVNEEHRSVVDEDADDDDQAYFPDADEDILPSVECPEAVWEDALQQDLLMDEASSEIAPPITTFTAVQIKSEQAVSSPSTRRIRKGRRAPIQAFPDSDDEGVQPPQPSSVVRIQGQFTCDVCSRVYKTAKNLQRHQDNPRALHDKIQARKPSIDPVQDDEPDLHSSPRPRIKREFSTPPPTNFLFSTSASNPLLRADAPSSGAKSASGIDRRAYLKQVKQSWAKKATPASKPLSTRKSFHTLPRKRAWAQEGVSDDELAS